MAENATTTRGMEHAKKLVMGYLEAQLPAYLEDLRVAWSLTEKNLPTPIEFLPNEPKALDKWPMLAIAGADRRIKRSPRSEGGLVMYDATYTLRVFTWVRESGFEETISSRDNLTAAVSTLLMDHVTLGTDGHAVVQDDGLVESYSDVQAVTGQRHVAGAFTEFQLLLHEAIVRDPIGTADTVSLEVVPHPAL